MLNAANLKYVRSSSKITAVHNRCGLVCHASLSAGLARRRRPEVKDRAESSRLRLFLDSANLTQWELNMSTGMFYGMTTNPVILERDNQKCTLKNLTTLARCVSLPWQQHALLTAYLINNAGYVWFGCTKTCLVDGAYAHQANELGAHELQLQAWGDSVQKIYSVALDLFGIDPKMVVVKLPCTIEGIQAASLLRDSMVRLTITGLYTSPQVMMAQSLGAEYAAPYLGRMNDAYGTNKGFDQVVEMQQILTASQSKTRLLVASVRDPTEMASLAAKGCDTFTISPVTAGKLLNVQYTLDAASEFEAAARRMGAYEESAAAAAAAAAEASLHKGGSSQDQRL